MERTKEVEAYDHKYGARFITLMQLIL